MALRGNGIYFCYVFFFLVKSLTGDASVNTFPFRARTLDTGSQVVQQYDNNDCPCRQITIFIGRKSLGCLSNTVQTVHIIRSCQCRPFYARRENTTDS